MNADLSEQQKKEVSGPQATDDLTIAENLRVGRQDFSGKGEEVYSDGLHPAFKIPEHQGRNFIEQIGPLHPGDYKEQFKRDWRTDFAALAK